MRALLDEALRAGERHAARATCDHCDLAIQLAHVRSVRSSCGRLGTPTRAVTVPSYAHRSVCLGLSWVHDRAGEGAAGRAPRPGRARAHPRRIAAALPRAGHQLDRRRPALHGGRGVQADALPALRRQGRAHRRAPAPLRSRRPAGGLRRLRPGASRPAPGGVRRPLADVPLHRRGRGDPGPGAPGARGRPATTSRRSRRGSPKPPARPAPRAPRSSASSWRCSWTALRPAAACSAPTPSSPPQPSRRSSSTPGSPSRRRSPAPLCRRGAPTQRGTRVASRRR